MCNPLINENRKEMYTKSDSRVTTFCGHCKISSDRDFGFAPKKKKAPPQDKNGNFGQR